MRKVYELDPHFSTGEATVQPVLLWGANGRPLRENFTKTASEAADYIKMVEPKPGTSIVLVLALGAYETYDLNRNGDGFNEFPYRPGLKPTCGCCQADGAWVTQSEVLPNHYKTFDEHGKIYRHHQNKDPAKACGDVIKSFWNPQMHRVELLLGLRNELAPDLAERIADGEYPAVSMGCRIKYDVCTICGHRAPTRKQYCEHLKFSMRQVTPSGLRAGALNPSPRFFDISFVVKPADLTGYMMKKVADEAYVIRTSAELGEHLDAVEEKRAAIRKLADIDKVIRGLPVDHKTSPLTEQDARSVQQYHDMVLPAVRGMPDFDNRTLKALSKFPVAQVLSTLSAAGVVLTTPEFVKMLVEKMSPGTRVSEEVLDRVVASQQHIFELFAQRPELVDQLVATGMYDVSPKNVKPEIGVIAEKYLEKRSTIGDYLTRQLIPPYLREEEPHWTDTLHVSDPNTGERYITTRAAAREAHDEIARSEMARLVGTGALLAGGAHVAAGALPTALRPLAWGGAAMLGSKALKPDYRAQYETEEGIAIPTLTELQKKTSSAVPLLASTALVTALSNDYESRLRAGRHVHNPNSTLATRILDRVSEFYHDHPVGGVLATLAVHGGLKKLGSWVSSLADSPASDSVFTSTLDFDDVVQKIGAAILE